MFSAAAAALIRRRRGRVVQRFNPLRSLFTQTRNYYEKRAAVPTLMVFSRDENPKSCRLFSLSRSVGADGKGDNFLRLEREILHLPETVAADRTQCIGSSEGILFTFFPTENEYENPAEIYAVDLLTGTHLPLPSTATLQLFTYERDYFPRLQLHEGKAIISPSRDTVVLSRSNYLDFARLDGGGGGGCGCWRPLPIDTGYIHDVIFHKGLLYALAYEGLIAIYDLSNPSWPTLLGNERLRSVPGCNYEYHSRLVESPDGKDLFLVFRRDYNAFKVFKLNRRGNWTRVRSIGDMAFFVGTNQCVSLPASHFPDILKPNSIYFNGIHVMDAPRGPSDTLDVGVYSLDDRSFQFFKLTYGQDHVLPWPAWPPPVWFIPPIYLINRKPKPLPLPCF